MRRLIGLLSVLVACGEAPATTTTPPGPTPTPSPSPSPSKRPDLAGPLFDPGHVVELAIELAPEDWDALRRQTRRVEDVLFNAQCLDHVAMDPFTYFPGEVTIDGARFSRAGVRKKGFLGSLSEARPSLKISLDELTPGVEHLGLETFTFNNSQQDPSLMRTCLAYRLHRRAGVPAPRCNFAHVVVNGQDLGVYVHVESVKKPYLRQHFADERGPLWEGTLSDFREGWMETFEAKGSTPIDARARLEALRVALESPSVEALEELVDLPRFLDYWAVESVVGHWDGYVGNANNFFVYGDPTSEKLVILPWGPDAAFTVSDNAASVMAHSALPSALYHLPEGKRRYLERVRALLSGPFDEADLRGEVERARALIAPLVRDGRFGPAIDELLGFIDGRRAAVLAELGMGGGPVEDALRESICWSPLGELEASFSTTWGTHPTNNAFTTGTGSFRSTGSIAHEGGMTGSAAGPGQSMDDLGQPVILVASLVEGGEVALVYVRVDARAYREGGASFDLGPHTGALLSFRPGVSEPRMVGVFFGGVLELERAGRGPGDPVVGRLRTTVYDPGG